MSDSIDKRFTLASQVHTDTLVPEQCSTPIGFQRACDFHQQNFIKHPGRSDFHCRAEYLHAGLLEGNPNILIFVPQPFKLIINGRRYTPDCYILDGSVRRVLEIKPQGVFEDEKRIPLEQYFELHGMKFEVVSNESIFEREAEAENWIEIVRTLYIAIDWDTEASEYKVLDYFYQHPECTFGDFVDPGDREGTFAEEVALFRLLHRGVIQADLTSKPLDYNTEVQLCT